MKTICVFVLLLVFAAIESNSRANWFFTCRLEEIVINISVLGVLGSISGSAQSVKSATFLSQVCEIDSPNAIEEPLFVLTCEHGN